MDMGNCYRVLENPRHNFSTKSKFFLAINTCIFSLKILGICGPSQIRKPKMQLIWPCMLGTCQYEYGAVERADSLWYLAVDAKIARFYFCSQAQFAISYSWPSLKLSKHPIWDPLFVWAEESVLEIQTLVKSGFDPKRIMTPMTYILLLPYALIDVIVWHLKESRVFFCDSRFIHQVHFKLFMDIKFTLYVSKQIILNI